MFWYRFFSLSGLIVVVITSLVRSEAEVRNSDTTQQIAIEGFQNKTTGTISETISGGVQIVPGIPPPCTKEQESEYQLVINGTISPDGGQIDKNSSKILCTPKINPGGQPPYKIEVVVPGLSLVLGEAPHWDSEKKLLFYVDILGRAIGRYVPRTGENSLIYLDGTTSFIVPVQNQPGNFIISQNRSLVKISVAWDTKPPAIRSMKVLHTVETNYPRNLFNDAKCDPAGRLWAGTTSFQATKRRKRSSGQSENRFRDLDHENYRNRRQDDQEHFTARLYTLGPNGRLSVKVNNLGESNGLEWSLDNTKFYHVDSATDIVYVYDYNLRSGQIRNRKIFRKFDLDVADASPDGMTMDTNGNLWVAGYSVGMVWNIDGKTGQTIRTLDFRDRALKVTSLAFGGEFLDELYVTSANLNLTPDQLKEGPDAGAIFRVTNLGVTGARPGKRYKE